MTKSLKFENINNGETITICSLCKLNSNSIYAPSSTVSTSRDTLNFYEGNIEPSDDTIFVFGSNPEGRHGAGAAKIAREQFGAKYGVGEGLTGNAYALPTKDLRVKENKALRSIPKETIIDSIKKENFNSKEYLKKDYAYN